MDLFVVDEYKESHTTGIVPKSWIFKCGSEDMAYYPPKDVSKRFKRQDEPDKECWTKYSVRIFAYTVAEETSNVDSDHGDGNNDENVPSLRIVNVDSLFVSMKVKMVTTKMAD
jgi:hypothetical protein